MKKSLKLLSLLTLALAVAAGLVTACAPQFGRADVKENPRMSDHYRDGKFFNPQPTSVSSSWSEMLSATVEYITGGQQRVPKETLPTKKLALDELGKAKELRVTWLGHSTALIEIDGKLVLTDPMFGKRASPFSFTGPKRFAADAPVTAEQLPFIDVVLVSHDHYDHLDYDSILALKEKVGRFLVPLGVGGHLRRWGVDEEKIVELDWWQERNEAGIDFAATPSRHFSGRGLRGNRTLWCSWVVRGAQERVYFSGDSGYFDVFRKIGETYGPFDITLLECGAYDKAWAQIHMMPEETAQAHRDLRGKLLLPIHWGKFNLALHAWTEPIERLLVAAQKDGIQVATPLQGEAVRPQESYVSRSWWREPVLAAVGKAIESR